MTRKSFLVIEVLCALMPLTAGAQSSTDMAVLKGLAPVTVLFNTPEGIATLLASAPNGSLVTFAYSSNLYSINPATGVPTLVGPTGWTTAQRYPHLVDQPRPVLLVITPEKSVRCRRELAELTLESLQRRDERWAIVDLIGKGRHIRTVPVPNWVKETLHAWLAAAGIESGPLFRCVCRAGKPWGHSISEKMVWHVVKKIAASMNIPRLAPHDLRRSCARLCHDSGGELEQIQFLLGHVSVQTTERYIGCKQRLRVAVNDRLGIEPG
jgi:Phage integrase family